MSKRFNEILLVEDNAAASERQRRIGFAEGNGASITVRVHRFNGADSRAGTIATSKTYKAGAMRGTRNGRINLAARLLERACPADGSVVVAGASYGSAGAFTGALCEKDLRFVVQLRPTTYVNVLGSDGLATAASDLLAAGRWQDVRTSLPDGTVVGYAAAKLADVELPNGCGRLFAARVGGVEGAQRTTIIGLSSFDAELAELVRLVGYTRWIRPASRRQARTAHGPTESAEPTGKAAALTARANIMLARKQDERARQKTTEDEFVPAGVLRGAAPTLNIVELFAGAGGMGLGFLLAGGSVGGCRLVYSGEANPIYTQTLRANHSAATAILDEPAGTITPENIEPVDLRRPEVLEEVLGLGREVGGVNVLIGGPPCQGFSMANRNSWHGRNPNNQLVEVFLRYVETLQPQVFLMENVQGILWTPKGKTSVSVVDVLERRLQSLGYLVFPKLLDAVWYGVPQHRTRFFLMGLHRDLGYEAEAFGDWGPFPRPSHGGDRQQYITVAQAIADLPLIANGDRLSEVRYREPTARKLKNNPFLRYVREGASRGVIYDHVTSRHADYVIERYRKIPPGENWESIRAELTNYADVSRTHSNIYRRLCWDEPSITIGHYRKSMIVHPEQHRGLSLREAARLQSFPDWFRFYGTADGTPGGLMHKQQQLANAVCPLVTKAIAEFMIRL